MTIKTNFKCNINHKYHKYGSINLGNIGQCKRIRDIYIDDHHVYIEGAWRIDFNIFVGECLTLALRE